MNAHPGNDLIVAPDDDGIAKGALLMDVKNVSLAFGGVKATFHQIDPWLRL